MRTAFTLVGLLLTLAAGAARSEDTVSDEEARKVGGLFASKARDLTGLPLATDVDPDKSRAVRSGEHGALVMPDRRLTSEAIAAAGRDAKPVGQLWMHKVTPIVDGQAVPADKLRQVSVDVRDEERTFSFFLLGVRKGGDGRPELLVYARGTSRSWCSRSSRTTPPRTRRSGSPASASTIARASSSSRSSARIAPR